MRRKPAGDGEARRPRPGPAGGEAQHIELLRGCRFLAALPHKRLRQLAAKLHAAAFGDGAQIIAQGDAATGMYFIERGRCAVTFAGGEGGRELGDGCCFGELALLAADARTADVHAVGDVACLRLDRAEVAPILQNCWGSDRELQRKEQMLSAVPIFEQVSVGERLELATIMEPVELPEPHMEIVTEGKRGDCMYVLESGTLTVSIRGVGCVGELNDGDSFGELAITQDASWRTATVTSASPAKCWRLSKQHVQHILTSMECAAVLQASSTVYKQRERLRSSAKIEELIQMFWGVVVVESNRLARGTAGAATRWQMLQRAVQGRQVTRAGYESLHQCITKALEPVFDQAKAADAAQADWANDIVK